MQRAFLVLCVMTAVACGSSDPPTAGSGGAGSGGMGGTAGTGAVGGDSGTGGAGTGGTGGTGGDAGMGGTGGGDPNRVAANQVCQRLAELQCQGEASCCQNESRRYPSTDACISTQRSLCEGNMSGSGSATRVTDIGNDPDAAYSMDATEVVFDEFERRVAACDPTIAAWGVSADGLRNMFRGTKGQNADCMPSGATDFAAAVSCRLDDDLVCVPGIPGTDLSPPFGWTCKARAGVGGPCFSDLNCQDDLHCVVPQTLSTCAMRKSAGQSCGAPNECLSLLCEGGSCVEANVEDAYCLGG